MAQDERFFATGLVAKLVGLPQWRVIKFARGKEYGIKPSKPTKGSGSPWLYDIENVCEIALAWWLFQAGLRSLVIGRALRQLRGKTRFSANLDVEEQEARSLYLVIVRTPMLPTPPQQVEFIRGAQELQKIFDERPNCDLVLIPIGLRFSQLGRRLEQLEAKKGD